VYQEYYAAHQLKSNTGSDIAWIGSLQLFFVFVGTLFGGPLFDRFGGKVILPAALVYVLAIIMKSLCHELWQFIVAQGLLGGIALGMTMGPANAATPRYFQKKRGVVFPIALGKMFVNPSIGFAWAVRICGLIALAILGPSSLLIRARLPPRKSNLFLPSASKDM
jgi:MFS family permease